MIFSNPGKIFSTQTILDQSHYYFLAHDHQDSDVKLFMAPPDLLLSIQASLHRNHRVYLLGKEARLDEFYQLEKKISLSHFHLELDILLLLPSLKKRFLPSESDLNDLLADLKSTLKWLK